LPEEIFTAARLIPAAVKKKMAGGSGKTVFHQMTLRILYACKGE
jgi:hypothetical protein